MTAVLDPPSSNGAGPAAPDLAAIVAKFVQVERELNLTVIESMEFIRRLILAIASRTHIYVDGTGGTGKSFGTQCTSLHFTLPVFYEIMQPDTKKEQMWGPISMKGLTEDRYEHAIQDFLATAGIALINEAKDAGAFLRQLLDAMEERVFKNGTAVLDIPLNSLIATSNFEIEPHEKHLAAFNDRFAQRYTAEVVQSRDGLVQILQGQIERDRGSGGKYVPQTCISPAELLIVQRAIVDCEVPKGILETIADLDADARRAGVELASARRLGAGRRLAQTDAVLNGHSIVSEENLHVFSRVLPSHSEEFEVCDTLCLAFKGKVAEAVEKLTKSLEQIAAKLAPERQKAANNVGKATGDRERPDMSVISDVQLELTEQKELTDKAIAEAVANGRDASPLEALAAKTAHESEFIAHDVLGMPR